MLVFEERGKPECVEKNLPEQGRELRNSTHIWLQRWDLNLGHIGERRVLSIASAPPLETSIVDKTLGTLLRFSGIFQFTQVQPLPSPHKQCGTRVSRIFSTLYRVGVGRTARKFRKGCTVLRGNREMTEKYEYCSTVPRNFVQDCWFIIFQ